MLSILLVEHHSERTCITITPYFILNLDDRLEKQFIRSLSIKLTDAFSWFCIVVWPKLLKFLNSLINVVFPNNNSALMLTQQTHKQQNV